MRMKVKKPNRMNTKKERKVSMASIDKYISIADDIYEHGGLSKWVIFLISFMIDSIMYFIVGGIIMTIVGVIFKIPVYWWEMYLVGFVITYFPMLFHLKKLDKKKGEQNDK